MRRFQLTTAVATISYERKPNIVTLVVYECLRHRMVVMRQMLLVRGGVMRRRFTVFAAMSLLLFVAFAFLWLRTSYKIDLLQSERFGRPWSICSTSGSIELSLMSPTWLQVSSGLALTGLSWSTLTADQFYSPWPLDPLPGVRMIGSGRSAIAANGTVVSFAQSTYHIPYWIPTILSAILPMVWCLTYLRHRRRQKAGMCRKCGYDLRGSPRRCPECGEEHQVQPAAA